MLERAAILAHAEGLPRDVPGDADALLEDDVLLPLSRHLRLDGGPGALSCAKIKLAALHAIDAISSP